MVAGIHIFCVYSRTSNKGPPELDLSTRDTGCGPKKNTIRISPYIISENLREDNLSTRDK